jgi:hypothetical protein
MLNAAVENMHYDQIHESRKSHRKLLKHFTHHLVAKDLEYFQEWDRLIDLEDSSVNKEITKAWLRPSQELEMTTGKTISSLFIQKQNLIDFETSITKVDAMFFLVCTRSPSAKLDNPLNALKFEVGSRVVLSSDGVSTCPNTTRRSFVKKHIFGLARGSVKVILEHSIQIQVSRSDYVRIYHLLEKSSSDENILLFRLDKDDFAGGFSILRQNLLNLFTSDIVPFSTKPDASQETLTNIQQRLKSRASILRRLIVHLDKPHFEQLPLNNILNNPAMAELSKDFYDLNEDQKAAALKVSLKKYITHLFALILNSEIFR